LEVSARESDGGHACSARQLPSLVWTTERHNAPPGHNWRVPLTPAAAGGRVRRP
jgi:hypothetical protein